MTSETRGSGHDWDEARKAALFARIVGLELSIEEAAQLHGLRVDVIQEWLRAFRRSALHAFDENLKKTLIGQGANADALAAAEFTGHIEDVSIADLVQTIAIAGKDAVITVTHEGRDHRMWCSAGAIVDAESGRLSPEAAAYRILSLERGRMVADLRPEARSRTIYTATHRLLLEAMRRKDEAGALLAKLGDVDRAYRLSERSTSARVHVSTDELSILRFFDGARRVGEILAHSQLGDLETLTALARLIDDGYLVSLDTPARPASDSRTARGGRIPRGGRAPGEARSGGDSRSASGTRPVGSPRAASGVRTASGVRSAGGRSASSVRSDASRRESASRAESSPHSERRTPSDNSARTTRAALPTEPRLERGATRAPGERSTGSMPAERAASSAPASAPSSYMPIAIPHAPAARATLTPRWVFGAMAAAALAPAAFWFGETMSNLRVARRARVTEAQPATAYAPLDAHDPPLADAAPTFEVFTRIQPPTATIWLDRHPVASGELQIVLPKDGRTHELRAAVDGYVPITLMFADVAPPREIDLERLPAPRPALVAMPPAPPRPAPPRPAPAQPASEPPVSASPASAPAASAPDAPLTPAPSAPPASAPSAPLASTPSAPPAVATPPSPPVAAPLGAAPPQPPAVAPAGVAPASPRTVTSTPPPAGSPAAPAEPHQPIVDPHAAKTPGSE